jgi:hypothetical protein
LVVSNINKFYFFYYIWDGTMAQVMLSENSIKKLGWENGTVMEIGENIEL